MGIESAILGGALAGTTLEIQSNLAPPITVDLGQLVSGQGEPALPVRLARPTFIIRRAGLELLRSAPAGETNPNAWKVTLIATVLGTIAVGALLGLILWKR